MKNWLIVSMILLAAIIAISISLFFYYTAPPLNSEKPLGTCQALTQNNGANKIEITFLTNKFSKDKIKKYTDFLTDSEPFSSYKESFNFYYAGETEDCSVTENNILFCYSKKLIKSSAVCPNDYVFVLVDKPSNIRSSSYDNVLSININHPNSVLIHEFAHAFATLADEYVPSEIPRGAKNCAKECSSFMVSDGCFQGCSKDSYYRSSEESVMRTLKTTDFKKLNTLLLKERLEKYG